MSAPKDPFLDVLHAWLPGGVAKAVVICLHDGDVREFGQHMGAVTPATRPFQAIDFRGKGSQLADYDALPMPTSTQVKHDLMRRASWKYIEQIVSAGALGCAQSHCAIWQDVMHDAAIAPDAWVVVFEADARVLPDWRELLHQLTAVPFPAPSEAQPSPGVLKLGWGFGHPNIVGRMTPSTHPHMSVLGGRTQETHAYAIRKSAIPAYLAAVVPITSQIDMAMGDAADVGAAPPQWTVNPRIVRQHIAHTLLSSSVRNKNAARAMLPDSGGASTTLLVLPWVLFAGVLAGLGVLLYQKYHKPK